MRRAVLFILFLTACAASRAGDEAGHPAAPWSAGPGDINHPVGVVPSAAVRIPEDWPLDSGGAITCRTCHLEFPSRERGASLRGGYADPIGAHDDEDLAAGSFCQSCHESASPGSRAGAHWMAMEGAHIRVGRDAAAKSAAYLDEISRRCLECHDGVSAGDAPGMRNASWSDADDHPVGMPYASDKDTTSDVGLRSVMSLPKAVRLPGGQVSCVSCHNLYSGKKGLLTVSLEGSALCFTCHGMK